MKSAVVVGVRPSWRLLIVPLWCALAVVALMGVARNGGFDTPPSAGSTEIAVREAIRQDVRQRFAAGDFAGLEALARRYRDGRTTTPSGVRELTVFYSGLHALAEPLSRDDTAGWQALDTALAAWRQAQPASATAVVATGLVLKRHAWVQRPRMALVDIAAGPDLGSEGKFTAFLRVARSYLEANATLAQHDPHWHVVRAELAMAEHEDLDQYFALIERGLAVDPSYLKLATTGLDYFAPNPRQPAAKADLRRLQAFIGTLERLPGSDAGLTARLYWHARSVGYGKLAELKAAFGWPKVVAGMDAVIAAHPDDWNIDNFARLACEAGDPATFRRLSARRKGPPAAAVWQNPALLEACSRS